MAGFAAAAFPDVDFSLRLVDTLSYLNWHQGPTHSLVLLPFWAWVLARLFAVIDRSHPRWQVYFVPAALGIAIHIGGDVITAYGTMLWAPFSISRFTVPLAFVIDPWLSAIVVAGLCASLLGTRARRYARLGLILLAGYIGFLALMQAHALQVGATRAAEHALADVAVHVLPQPLSPFNWLIIVQTPEIYAVARVNLRRDIAGAPLPPTAATLRRMAAAYAPVGAAPWHEFERFGTEQDAGVAAEAWNAPAFASFRRFAAFPVLDRVDRDGERVCAWFHDLRFSVPALPPSFRFGVCRDGEGQGWILHRRRGKMWID